MTKERFPDCTECGERKCYNSQAKSIKTISFKFYSDDILDCIVSKTTDKCSKKKNNTLGFEELNFRGEDN